MQSEMTIYSVNDDQEDADSLTGIDHALLNAVIRSLKVK
jgi:hypothetical protein